MELFGAAALGAAAAAYIVSMVPLRGSGCTSMTVAALSAAAAAAATFDAVVVAERYSHVPRAAVSQLA